MAERITCKRRRCVSGRCKKARRCACDVCGPLKNISSTLFESCIDVCQHDPRPSDMESYLCGTVSPQVLYNSYGLEMCGFSAPRVLDENIPLGPPVTAPIPAYPQYTPSTSPIPQNPIVTSQSIDNLASKEEKSTMLYIWIALGLVAVIGGGILLYQSKK